MNDDSMSEVRGVRNFEPRTENVSVFSTQRFLFLVT